MTEMILCSACNEAIDGRMFGRTTHGHRWCEPCWKIENAEEIEADAKIDRWHTGYFAKERPTDPDELDGWLYRHESQGTHVVPVERPEGYYHMPLGTFD